jgi:flagellar operon protein (TIGR03826 family)
VDLRNCPRCGRLFTYISKNLCPVCIEEDEKEFKKVKEYVWAHRGCSAVEVHEATGVSLEKILNYLREGRLEARGLKGPLLFCESCGEPIDQGRFCPKCSDQLVRGLKGEENSKKPSYSTGSGKEKNKMYLADRIIRR